MSEYYHHLTTKESFKVLRKLKKKFDFTLIGGWAVYLHTKAMKSKDIDIIVSYQELDKVKKGFQVRKNNRLKKYEVKLKETDIDVYVPFYSDLGVPVKLLQKETKILKGFKVPKSYLLLITKLYTYQERKGSSKGEKDIVDIFSLISKTNINWKAFKKETNNKKELLNTLKKLIKSTKEIPQLSLTEHQMAKIKKELRDKINF